MTALTHTHTHTHAQKRIRPAREYLLALLVETHRGKKKGWGLYYSLCLTYFPSMGNIFWFICIDPLRKFVWKGVGMGRAIFPPFSFVKRIVLPLGRSEDNCTYSLIVLPRHSKQLISFDQSTPIVVLHRV